MAQRGVDITHARYPMTSYPRGLGLCACDRCVATAAEMGFDLPAIIEGIGNTLRAFAALDPRRLADVAGRGIGLVDLLNLLGMDLSVLDWLRFRARLLGRNVSRFRDVVHAAAGREFIFGADTYPASLAMLVGHDMARWDEHSDFASPLVSHLDIFPMQTMTACATLLRELQPELAEGDALRLIYDLSGYTSLDLPECIADYALSEPDCEWRNVPLREWLYLDMARARLFLPANIPSYPIIQGGRRAAHVALWYDPRHHGGRRCAGAPGRHAPGHGFADVTTGPSPGRM